MKDQQARLVLVPCPLQGHLNPMLQLAATLQSKGFRITIAQNSNLIPPNSSNHPLFNFLGIEGDFTEQDLNSPDKTGLVLHLNDKSEAPFQDCLKKMIENETEDGIVCVIYDELAYFAEAAASSLGIPSILFRTTNAFTYLVRSSPPFLLRAEGRLPLPDPTSHEPAPEHPILRAKDVPVSNFGSVQSFFKLLSLAMNIGKSKAIICNTMAFLEHSSLSNLEQQVQVPIFAIGPLHKIVPVSTPSTYQEDTSCIQWLNNQATNSVIYISPGSLVTISQKVIAEMAWGLANSMQPFLWVVRPGSVHGSEWIESLPEGFKECVGDRGCIVKWAPQREVLAHEAVGGFWSHCGWNSVLESICEGVPLLCRPGFGDQQVTARLVSEEWRVGLHLDEVELQRGDVEEL